MALRRHEPCDWRTRAISTAGSMLALVLTSAQASATPSVLVRGVDPSGTGANLAETVLNTSNVTAGSFGRLFSLPVDGQSYAQPLYVPGVVMSGGGTHNVLYVATMNNFVYAFDADVPGPPLWSFNAATALQGAAPVPTSAMGGAGYGQNIYGNLGIQGTPVIDASSQTIYFVTKTLESARQVFRLHALDITAGTEKFGGSIPITAKYTAGGTTLTFDPSKHLQRISLTLADGNVIIGFGSYGDSFQYYGWMMAYDAQTLAQTGVFVSVPTAGHGGAFWQSGRAPVVDQNGFVYAFTGNAFGANGYDGINNFSETCVKLDPRQGLKLIDWFTPANWAQLDQDDGDLSASGPLLLPGTTLLFGAGKDHPAFLFDSNHMGHLNGALQQFTFATGETHAGPVAWQRSTAHGGTLIFNWATTDVLKAWAFNGTKVTGLSQQGSTKSNSPGNALALSANGDAAGTGVLWSFGVASGDSDNDQTPSVLSAYNANNVTVQLWNSLATVARDDAGLTTKFLPPTVANGKVYVATGSNQIVVYGLLPASPGFNVTAQPAKGYALGGTASFYLAAIKANGSAAAPNWSVAGLPGNSVATFSTDAQGRTVMQVANLGSVPDGPYYLTVTASSGAISAAQTVLLQVVTSTPVKPVSASATSIYGSDIAAYAIDMNPATIWHAAFGQITSSLYLDLGSVMKVDALSYLPRQDGCTNGTYFQYIVWLSTDKVTWTLTAANAFDYNLQKLICDTKSFPRPQTLSFAPQSARYVRFQEVTEVQGLATAAIAELQAFGTSSNQGPPPTLSGLSLSSGDVTSGATVTGTVQLSDPALTGGATVTLTSSDPAKLSVPGSVVVGTGQTSATFTATSAAGASGSVTVTATYSGGSDSATVTLHASIAQTGWKLLFVDSQAAAYPATNAFDGNVQTFWHTQYGTVTPVPPHEIQIDLGSTQQLTGLIYTPRRDGCDHGTISQYEFYVSADGVNWGSAVTSGQFKYGTNSFPCGGAPALPAQTVYFNAVTGRFIRLRALSEVTAQPWTSAAEINVLQ